jgi:hypothetical protein
LELLQIAHECDCKWDKTTLTAAATRGHKACFDYLEANHCPGYGEVVLQEACPSVMFGGGVGAFGSGYVFGMPATSAFGAGAPF